MSLFPFLCPVTFTEPGTVPSPGSGLTAAPFEGSQRNPGTESGGGRSRAAPRPGEGVGGRKGGRLRWHLKGDRQQARGRSGAVSSAGQAECPEARGGRTRKCAPSEDLHLARSPRGHGKQAESCVSTGRGSRKERGAGGGLGPEQWPRLSVQSCARRRHCGACAIRPPGVCLPVTGKGSRGGPGRSLRRGWRRGPRPLTSRPLRLPHASGSGPPSSPGPRLPQSLPSLLSRGPSHPGRPAPW